MKGMADYGWLLWSSRVDVISGQKQSLFAIPQGMPKGYSEEQSGAKEAPDKWINTGIGRNLPDFIRICGDEQQEQAC